MIRLLQCHFSASSAYRYELKQTKTSRNQHFGEWHCQMNWKGQLRVVGRGWVLDQADVGSPSVSVIAEDLGQLVTEAGLLLPNQGL